MGHDIMIVGNGEIGEKGRAATAKADFVIRFNDCRSYAASPYRTDAVAVCNTGRPGKRMGYDASWRALPPVRDTSEIWSARDPRLFCDMRQALLLTRPDLDDFCDDYTNLFAAFCTETSKDHLIIDRAIHACADDEVTSLSPPAYVVPSTGLVAIIETFRRFPGADVAITGFSHTGWTGHPFSAEQQIVNGYARRGLLTRYDL